MASVKDLLGVRSVKGDVGIEIEVEGSRLPRTGEHWNAEHDGSLRGESMEYVLKKPMSLPKAKEALDYLAHKFKENGSEIEDTGRAGVHIHVNCQDMKLVPLYNFFTLYLCLEDLLVSWCGPDRVGNLFCLTAGNAERIIDYLTKPLDDPEHLLRRSFQTDALRYASMNVNALPRYGSVEFRAMRSTDDMESIYRWASMLVGLRDKAKEIDNPTDIIYQISAGGEEAFLRHYLGDFADEVMVGEWQGTLIEGMRRAQEVAFAGDWGALAKGPKRRIGGVQVEDEWDDDFPPMDI